MGLAVAGVTLCGTIPVKMMFGRERPAQIKSVRRICNMREREEGTKSMPSGDTTVGAFICGAYMLLFEFPWFYFIFVPLVCLSRVYVHCHWFGDVVAGAIVGTVFMLLFF